MKSVMGKFSKIRGDIGFRPRALAHDMNHDVVTPSSHW